jgi:chromosomal replication initiation ATPase DnaA
MSVLKRRAEDLAAADLAASVASYALGVERDAILNFGRGNASTAYARQVAFYLCHSGFQMSLARVAAAFGRDRSTVAHACHLIEDRREEAQFDMWLAALEQLLRAAVMRRRQS